MPFAAFPPEADLPLMEAKKGAFTSSTAAHGALGTAFFEALAKKEKRDKIILKKR
ncbi:MAG TPA: hypothetical protein VNG29_03000 [Candidatus Paceibacterota bacterium]|nr:hypothetical protein [Candidatus Paceibacterota bacterium]